MAFKRIEMIVKLLDLINELMYAHQPNDSHVGTLIKCMRFFSEIFSLRRNFSGTRLSVG